MANPSRFIAEVRQEAAKVVWPTRKETWQTTGFVLLMTVLASVFLTLVDLVMRLGVEGLVGLAEKLR